MLNQSISKLDQSILIVDLTIPMLDRLILILDLSNSMLERSISILNGSISLDASRKGDQVIVYIGSGVTGVGKPPLESDYL